MKTVTQLCYCLGKNGSSITTSYLDIISKVWEGEMIWERRVVWDRLIWGWHQLLCLLSEMGVWRGGSIRDADVSTWAQRWLGTISTSVMALTSSHNVLLQIQIHSIGCDSRRQITPSAALTRVVFPVLVTHSGLDSCRMMAVSDTLLRRKAWVFQRRVMQISRCLGLSCMYPWSPAVAETGFPFDELSLPFTMWITDPHCAFSLGKVISIWPLDIFAIHTMISDMSRSYP